MPPTSTQTPRLGRFGVWTFRPVRPEQAKVIEQLGYGTVWAGGSPSAALDFVEPILAQTRSLTVATGVINVWTAPAKQVAESFHRIESAYPGRFLLGVGIGHPELSTQYQTPYKALAGYLDELDDAGVPPQRRIVAALGPRVLELAAARSAGAHPYLTNPAHTAFARETIGAAGLLTPEHKVVLTGDAAAARAIGRDAVGPYMGLRNYRNNWKRLGFTDQDINIPGSDAFIDSVVAHGEVPQIAAQLNAHLTAGADHVTVQVLGGWDKLLPTLTELSGALTAL